MRHAPPAQQLPVRDPGPAGRVVRRLAVVGSLLFGAVLAASPAGAAGGPKPTIAGATARLDHDRAIISFTVVNGITDDVLERIDSGIPVTFRHRIEIVARRGFMLPAKVLVRVVIETRAEYDSLTRRYDLWRGIELKTGRRRDNPPLREETRLTSSVDEMRRWMTEFSDLVVYDPFRPIEGERLRVRVTSSVGRRYIWSIFPADLTASAEWMLEP